MKRYLLMWLTWMLFVVPPTWFMGHRGLVDPWEYFTAAMFGAVAMRVAVAMFPLRREP